MQRVSSEADTVHEYASGLAFTLQIWQPSYTWWGMDFTGSYSISRKLRGAGEWSMDATFNNVPGSAWEEQAEEYLD